jgi:hypothetical protein
VSKFIPDPQIQSLKAMRAGDIAFALPNPATLAIGKMSRVIANVPQAKSLTAVESLEAVAGTPSEVAGPVGVAFVTFPSADAFQSKSLGTVEALEALSGTPSESPVIGVGTGTAVI